jgi:hypothetical protein
MKLLILAGALSLHGEHNDGINNARSTWEVLGTHNNITILFLYNGVRREQMIYKYTLQRRPL